MDVKKVNKLVVLWECLLVDSLDTLKVVNLAVKLAVTMVVMKVELLDN